MKPIVATIILAAGKGVRMKSDLAKVLHSLNGHPMIHYVIRQALEIGSDRIFVVIGHQKEKVCELLKNYPVQWVIQQPQLGTGHAVQQVQPELLDYHGDVLILSGDVPLITKGTLQALIRLHRQNFASATLVTVQTDNPLGYGRIIRNETGQVVHIVEEKDATDSEKLVREINAGIYMFDSKKLFDALTQVKPDNRQKEYYLPDVIQFFQSEGEQVSAWCTSDFDEIRGINTPEQLLEAERILLYRLSAGK